MEEEPPTLPEEPPTQAEAPLPEEAPDEAPEGAAPPPPQQPKPEVAPKVVRIRRPRAAAPAPLAIPEIDDRFWAELLSTQRHAERATRLQRISDFKLM